MPGQDPPRVVAELDTPLPPPLTPPQWLRTAAEFAWRILLVGALVALAVVALVRLRVLVIPVLLAILFTAMLAAPVRWLRARGVPRSLTAAIVFLGSLGLLGLVLYVVGNTIAGEFDSVSDSASEGVDEVRRYLTDLGLPPDQLERWRDDASQWLKENRKQLTAGAVSGAGVAAEVVTGIALTLFTLFFLLKDGDRIWGWVVRQAPERHRGAVEVAGAAGFLTLAAYIRGISIIAAVDAFFIGLGLLILGVPLVLPLTVIVFLGAFVPLIGATLAGVFAALVALVTEGPVTAVLVIAVVVAVNQLEGNLLEPVVLGHTLPLHPLAIALVLAAGTLLAGITGAILSVPIAAVAVTVVRSLRASGAANREAGAHAVDR